MNNIYIKVGRNKSFFEDTTVFPFYRNPFLKSYVMHSQPPNTADNRHYFTFEGRQYYAINNAPGYVGMMIFTGSGVACERALHEELWMFYQGQKSTEDPKIAEIS